MRISSSLFAIFMVSLAAASPLAIRANGDNANEGGASSGNGSSSNKNVCGVTPDQISALTPLLNKLGLSTTVDGVKELVNNLAYSTGELLQSPGINGKGGAVDLVNNVSKGLLGETLDLHNTVDFTGILLKEQIPCLLDTVAPKP